MSKQLTAIIIILILFLILGGVFGYFYFRSDSSDTTPTSNPRPTVAGDAGFPVGEQTGVRSNEQGVSINTNDNIESSDDADSFIISGVGDSLTAPRRLVNIPVAGMTVYNNIIGQTVVRYIERETGHTEDHPIDESAPSRVTDTTIPKVFNAVFGKGGEAVVLQEFTDEINSIGTVYAEVVKAKSADAPPTAQILGDPNLATVVGSLEGSLLPDSVQSVAVSPDGKSFLYMDASSDGGVALVAPADRTKLDKPVTAFASKLSEWVPDWPVSNTLTFTTKASANLPGFMYITSVANKSSRLLLKNIPGLTAKMSPDGQLVVYAENVGTGFSASVYSVAKDRSTRLSLRTLPEKCVWSKKSGSTLYCAVPVSVPAGIYPDDWYMGFTLFNDELWRVDTVSGETTRLSTTGNQDMIKLILDDKEENIFWINKADSTVWTLQLLN